MLGRNYFLFHRGPTTFDLQVALQKRDNLRGSSNKWMYEATDSQGLY